MTKKNKKMYRRCAAKHRRAYGSQIAWESTFVGYKVWKGLTYRKDQYGPLN